MSFAFVQSALIALALVLFVLGTFGVLWRRNLLVALLSLQLMLAAGLLAFVGFSLTPPVAPNELAAVTATGQSFAVIAATIGVTEFVVGLAIVLAVVRNRDSVDVEDATAMRW